MARIRQFAKDMGLSYNKAKNLVNKGRKLRDEGSSVLEKHKMAIKVLPKKKKKYNPDTDIDVDEMIRDAEKKTPGIMEATGVKPKKKAYGGANKVKPVKAATGKFKNPNKAKMGQFKNIQNAAATGKITPDEALKKIQALVRKKSKGGGLAIQGLGFRGVR